jgi:hypothetical protein
MRMSYLSISVFCPHAHSSVGKRTDTFQEIIAITKAFWDIRLYGKCFGGDSASIFRAVRSLHGTPSRRMQQEILCGGGEIFRTSPDRPWGPHSLLYNAYRVFFSGVKRPGRGVDHPPHLAPRLKKERSYTSAAPLGLRGLF